MGLTLTGCYTPPVKKPDKPVADWNSGVSSGRVSSPAPAVTNLAPVPVVAPPVAKLPPELTWRSLSRWTAEHGLAAPRRVAAAPKEAFAVAAPPGLFALQPGTTTALWNGVELRLGFKPYLTANSNDLMVHALDLAKNLHPLLAPGLKTNSGRRVIVIDPGHGGGNRGTSSSRGGFEKQFTLDWGLRLAALLRTNGWTVHLTRSNDVEVPLPTRVEMAEALQADLFVSLHFNHSGGGVDPAGVETYCLTPVGMESTLTRGYPDDPTEVLPNNAFDAENLQLAARVHRELVALGGLQDRGIRRARFQTVLRGQNRPAILIEGGFLSNESEAARIASPAFRQKLAEAVARGLNS